MKLTILQEKLKHGLNIIERKLPKSLTHPILNTVSIKAYKNLLNLTVTNLEIGINWWTLAKIEREGEIAVPPSILENFLSFLPNKPVVLQKKDPYLIIECENYKTQIKSFSTEDFPLMPQIQSDDYLEINSHLFCEGLEQVVEIASPSSIRPEIGGVFISIQENIIKITATDSFRLGEKSILQSPQNAIFNGINKDISFIVPQQTIKEVINVFGQKEGNIKIYLSPNQIIFENKMEEIDHPETQITSRLIEGDYPPYQEIIPLKHEVQIVLPRSEFLNHLKAASVFAGKINEVKLRVDVKKGGVWVYSQNPDKGEYNSFLPSSIKGGATEASFNYRFLISGLTNIKSTEIILGLSKDEGPATLKPVGDASYVYVVMPIRAS